MKCNSIQIKFKIKNYANLNNKRLLILFRLSIGNDSNNLEYSLKSNKNFLDDKFIYKFGTLQSRGHNKNKEQYSVQNLEIINKNNYIKINIAKMKYKIEENLAEKKLVDKIFLSNNMKRAKVIINNKQYDLTESINNEINKIKIKFFDYAIYINSMFKDCMQLISVYNLQKVNTKYLKSIKNLFDGCSSLIFIDDISNWNINNINDISY